MYVWHETKEKEKRLVEETDFRKRNILIMTILSARKVEKKTTCNAFKMLSFIIIIPCLPEKELRTKIVCHFKRYEASIAWEELLWIKLNTVFS